MRRREIGHNLAQPEWATEGAVSPSARQSMARRFALDRPF